MRDFDTVYDRLECPHTSSCDYQDPMWSVTTATKEGKLSLDVECNNCHGADHLMFDVGSLDRTSQVDFEVGDKLTVKENLRNPRRVDIGDVGKITAIADNPLYSGDRPVVGVVFGIDSGAPYMGHLFNLDVFESLVGDKISLEV